MPSPATAPWDLRAEDYPCHGSPRAQMLFLLQYAALAPSPRNSQPWRFAVSDGCVHVFADLRRSQNVSDGDKRDFYLSLGCAIENFLIAAAYFEFDVFPMLFPDPDTPALVAEIDVTRDGVLRTREIERLFHAIPRRATNHNRYLSDKIDPATLADLAGAADSPDLLVYLTDDAAARGQVDALNLAAERALFASHEYREELRRWIGRDVFNTPWLVAKLGELVSTYLSPERLTGHPRDVLFNAPVVGVVCARANDHRTHVRAGQLFERVFLRATAHGLAMQPMSQTMQVGQTKRAMRDLISPHGEWVPQQPFRLGYPAAWPKHQMPRRAVSSLID